MKKVLCLVVILALILALLTGCEEYVRPKDATEQAAIANEKAVESLIKSDSLPTITKSMARAALKRQAEFINQPDLIGYLYLFAENGVLLEEIQILGVPVSLNSYMTPMEELTVGRVEGFGSESYVAEAPDIDGTWGTRPEGIFWFTPDGSYDQWNGKFRYSSTRKSFSTQPILIDSIE
jgi:hypothetical protein